MGGSAGAPGSVAYDLTEKRKASPVLVWVLVGVVIVGAAAAIFAFVFSDDSRPTLGEDGGEGAPRVLDDLGVSIVLPPGTETSREGSSLRLLVPAPSSVSATPITVHLSLENGGSAATRARQWLRSQRPRWKEAGVFSQYRRRRLRRGELTKVYEILYGPRPSLLGSVPDNARGPVDHRIYLESASDRVLVARWQLPTECPEGVEDRIETMIATIRPRR